LALAVRIWPARKHAPVAWLAYPDFSYRAREGVRALPAADWLVGGAIAPAGQQRAVSACSNGRALTARESR